MHGNEFTILLSSYQDSQSPTVAMSKLVHFLWHLNPELLVVESEAGPQKLAIDYLEVLRTEIIKSTPGNLLPPWLSPDQ